MRIALPLATLLFFGLLPDGAHAQEDLPIDTDSIYSVLSGTSEQLPGGQAVPKRLKVAEWRADLDTLAAEMHQRMHYAETAMGGRRRPCAPCSRSAGSTRPNTTKCWTTWT